MLESEPAGRWRRVGTMLWGCGIFVLLAAPLWLVFLDALKNSWTPYDTPKAFQIQPALALGLFDDLFYRQFTAWENHYNPSANFLILLGCAWALVNVRALLADRMFVALALGALPSAALAFGVIPASLITRVPFLGNVEHIDNTFSVVLIVHLIVLAGYGLRALWDSAKEPESAAERVLALAVIGALFALYFGSAQAIPREIPGPSVQMNRGLFFTAYAAALALCVGALPWVVQSLRKAPSFGAVLTGALLLFLVHFRQGMWTETKFDYYVMNPKGQAELAPRLTSLQAVKAGIEESGEPARVAAFRMALAPGYNAMWGFENFVGTDALVGRRQRELCAQIRSEPLWGWRWQIGAADDRLPRFTQKLCDLWNIRWLLAIPSDAPDMAASGELTFIKSPFGWPRAFFTEQLLECSSLENFTELLSESEGPFAAVTPMAKDPTRAPAKPDDLKKTSHYPARDYRLTSNSTTFSVQAAAPGVAVLTETHEPDNWRVTLDGRPVDYFRVNHAYLGVKISTAGEHTLSFEYWPRIFTTALWLGGAGGFLVLLTPLLARLCFGEPPIR